MASTARELRYNSRHSVDGNLAYDLEWEVRERELRHAGELPRRREAAQEAPKVRSVSKVQVRERQHVSLVTALGFAAVIVMAVLILGSYIQLTMLSSETVKLQSELAELETENVRLTAQYEQIFHMASVKEAAEQAGMGKPSSSQITYIDLSDGDSAVVYQKEDPSVLDKLLASLNHGIYAVVEYFD